jgi:hypothetical protein
LSSTPPEFGPGESGAPPALSTDLDGHTLTFAPLGRSGWLWVVFLGFFYLREDWFSPAVKLGAIALLLGVLLLSIAGYKAVVRVSSGSLKLETKLLGRVLWSRVLSFDTIEKVQVSGPGYATKLVFSVSSGPDVSVRLGSKADHELLASWLGEIAAPERESMSQSASEVPEALQRLVAHSRGKQTH